jgi:hypothetical protein
MARTRWRPFSEDVNRLKVEVDKRWELWGTGDFYSDEWVQLEMKYQATRMNREDAFSPVWLAAVRWALLKERTAVFIHQGMDADAAEVAAALSMTD